MSACSLVVECAFWVEGFIVFCTWTWHHTALLHTSSHLHRPLLAPRLMSGLSCWHAVPKPLSSTQQHHSMRRSRRRSHLLGLGRQVGTDAKRKLQLQFESLRGHVCHATSHLFWQSPATRMPHTAVLTERCPGCPLLTDGTRYVVAEGHRGRACPAWAECCLQWHPTRTAVAAAVMLYCPQCCRGRPGFKRPTARSRLSC